MADKKTPAGTAASGKKKGGKSAVARLRSLEVRANDEVDPAWRRWYLEVDQRRKALHDRKRKPFIVSTFEKDGQEYQIARRQSEPTPLKQFIKVDKKKSGSKITQDLLWIRDAWVKSVGLEIADETEVHAFKNGVLTISVHSSVLLQEIRQFHAEEILADLRDIWQASIPLLRITYRLGKK